MRRRSVLFSTGAGVLACLLALPVLTTAQGRSRTQWESQVREQLRAVTALLNLGYDVTSSYRPFVGTLRHNTYTDVTYTLQRGVPYALVGVCDNDCPDLDLELYDENYNLIDSDTNPDATPIIEVTPKWTGTFHVRVIMSRCNNSPCWYGIGEYEPAS